MVAEAFLVTCNKRVWRATVFFALMLSPSFLSAQSISRTESVIFDLVTPIQETRNFNWYTRSGRREHGAHQSMWEPLFLLNYETGQLEPWLGVSLAPRNSASPDEWTLVLRRGVTWSDGTPFTADDVVFTVNELVLGLDSQGRPDSDRARRAESLIAHEALTIRQQVQHAVKVDSHTVTFRLKRPNPRFALENFAGTFFGSFLIMPAHRWREALNENRYATPAEFRFENPIGTGPYRPVPAESSPTRMVWVRNDDWWGAKPPPPPTGGAGTPPGGTGTPFRPLPEPRWLEWRVLGSDAQSKAALEQNDLDAGRVMSLETLREAQASNPRIIGWDPASPVAWNDPCARQLEVNTLREPWTDPRLRRAVSLLIDRQILASTVYGGAAVPSRTLFPEYGGPPTAPPNAASPSVPLNAGLRASIEEVVGAGLGVAPRADATEAAAQLATAGWIRTGDFFRKDDNSLTVTILVNVAQAQDVQIAREVARQLTAAGINARTSEVSNAEFWGEAIPKGNYEMALTWLACGSVAEPYTSLARYAVAPAPLGVRSPGFNNTGRWTPAQDFVDIVTRELGLQVLSPADVSRFVVRAYRHLSNEMPIIPLIQSPRIIPFNTTYWNSWPVRGGPGVPMHSWGSTHRIIHALRRVQ